MKKILIISDSFTGYGAEYMIGWVGNMLAANGYYVVFCSLYDKEKNQKLSKQSVFFKLNLDRNSNPVYKIFHYFLLAGARIARYCKQNEIDFVITFKENPLCLALFAKLCSKAKLIHSERDDPYNRNTISARFKMWLYRFADCLIFQTRGAQEFFPKSITQKSAIIPNPVSSIKQQWCLSASHKTIANVGRLDIKFKRQDLLIKAFSLLDDRYKDWNLVFYGDGKDKRLLEQLVQELDLIERVKFMGKVDDVQSCIINDGLFVLTSDTEGLPNALLEAMALGMPVISTDCRPGGARFVINNEENGILIERSSVIALHRALQRVILDSELKERIGIQAKQSLKSLEPSLIAEKWVKILKTI